MLYSVFEQSSTNATLICLADGITWIAFVATPVQAQMFTDEAGARGYYNTL
jgi:hypothetical protein